MLDKALLNGASCVRLFKFLVLPGMDAAYRDYLREVVEPIDLAARQADVFLHLVTIVPAADAPWNHGRLFTFRDPAQRAAMPAAMAAVAARFDGSDDARDRRKRHAETLRRQIAISDYTLS